MNPPVVLVLGPSRQAVSGVSTHVNLLLESRLQTTYRLVHFQVGREGRRESLLGRIGRLVFGPFLLAAAILRHNAAIVHINMSFNAKAYWRDLLHLAIAKACGARVVYQKHGGYLAEFARNPLFAPFVRATLRWPDAVVVLAELELLEYQAFVPGQNIVYVPNGVDPAPYRKHPRGPADPKAPLQLLYIGRLASHKGVRETLDALALARVEGVTPQFIVAGSGADERRLRAQVRELHLGEQVRFAGAVHGDAKTRLLCSADVLLLASYTEGLPYSLLEGMAAGLVPIVTPVGAVPEVMQDRQHGRIVPMKNPRAIAEAIVGLDRDRAALARMSQASRRRIATSYTLERLAANFTEIYASLASPLQPSQAG